MTNVILNIFIILYMYFVNANKSHNNDNNKLTPNFSGGWQKIIRKYGNFWLNGPNLR